MNLICFSQDSWQCSRGPNSNSIHLDFTVLRFNSDSIQHRPDSVQTQVSFSCFQFNSKFTKKAELNWNRFWIWIDCYISALDSISMMIAGTKIKLENYCWKPLIALKGIIKKPVWSVATEWPLQMAMENVTTGQNLHGWAGPVERKLRIDLLIRGNLGSYSFVFVKTYF